MTTLRRVSVDLPSDLLDAAQEVTGTDIAETLIEGLEHLRRRRFYERAMKLRGKMRLEINLDVSRGRRRL